MINQLSAPGKLNLAINLLH